MTAAWRPTCMSSSEFDEWKRGDMLARRRAGVAARSICADCPAAFRQENLIAGTCNGAVRASTPTSEPKRLQTWREYKARSRAGIRVRRSPAEVAALQAGVVALRQEGVSWAAIARRYSIDPKYAYDLNKREQAA